LESDSFHQPNSPKINYPSPVPILACLLLLLLVLLLACGLRARLTTRSPLRLAVDVHTVGSLARVFACGQLQRHRIEEDAMAADLMTFTTRSEDCLHGQETYHFIATA